MKYPEHYTEFWRVRNADTSITNIDFALYSYLLNCLNSNYWKSDRLTQRRELICGLLSISPKQLEESRNRLSQKGFITFIAPTTTNKSGRKQGIKGSATTYIVLDEITPVGANSVPNSVPIDTPNVHDSYTKRTRSDTAFKYKSTTDSSSNKPKNLEEVKTYFSELKIKDPVANAEKFFNHYDANGWMRGKTPIKKWKACVKTWDFEREPTGKDIIGFVDEYDPSDYRAGKKTILSSRPVYAGETKPYRMRPPNPEELKQYATT